MLRELFGEQPREWSGLSLDTVQWIEKFVVQTTELVERLPEQSSRFRTYIIWAEGLLRSMDELEQSCYAAKRYSGLIEHNLVDELSPKERIHYYQHVYYDKNAYIRTFAILDKLGTLVNHLLNLHTERYKAHFSYFTMLRNLRENHLYVELMKPLNDLKEQHQAAMSRLRNRRNLEIHQMNAELRDDLKMSLANNGGRRSLEDLAANMSDLDEGWEMVQGSLNHAFRFGCHWLRKKY